MEQFIILSVRPQYARLIMEGEKKIEVRKRRPRLSAGDLVFIYSTSPIKKVLGVICVAKIEEETSLKLWGKVKETVGLSREEYDRYFAGRDVGVGIYLEKVRPFDRPVNLDDLRRTFKNFVVPQSYRYLSMDEAKQIIKMGGL